MFNEKRRRGNVHNKSHEEVKLLQRKGKEKWMRKLSKSEIFEYPRGEKLSLKSLMNIGFFQ